MNDFIDAIKNNKKSDKGEESNPSSERYNELKQEEAGVDSESPAKKRFNKLKEEAKEKLVESEKASQEASEEENDDEGFITH